MGQLWGRFTAVRKHLEKQYSEPAYREETGLSAEALDEAAERLLKEHAEESKVLLKARFLELVYTKAQIDVDGDDFFADHLNHNKLLWRIRSRWTREVSDAFLPYETAWKQDAAVTGLLYAELDLGHTCPGWKHFLSKGLKGLLEEAREARIRLGDQATKEQKEFLESLEISYGAMISFAHRLAAEARLMGGADPDCAERMELVANTLDYVPENPPRTLQEALQACYLLHQGIEMEGEFVRSMGGFDRLFYPYYSKDLEEGRLTRDQAKELISYYWIKFFANTRGAGNGKNFFFGGCDATGKDSVNDLTYAALEVFDELDVTDPKLSVRISKDTPEELLRVVCRIMRQGKTAFVLVNDDVAIPSIVKYGKSLEDARNYTLIGCYEPAIEGREIACNMSIKINLAKAVELAMFDGLDPVSGRLMGYPTGDATKMDFDGFTQAVLTQIRHQVNKATEYVCRCEDYWMQINPSPLLGGTFADGLYKLADVGQSGPFYNNTGCMGAGLANVADSLMAVKRIVFDEKRCTMKELMHHMRTDFAEDELLRRYIIHRVPKYGNNDPEVDALAVRVAEEYTKTVNETPNHRGGWFRASLFTLDHRFSFGKRTGATPDGRPAGEYLAGGVGAMTARDFNGLTAQILSVTKIDFSDVPNGSVVDIYLHPSAVQGEDGLAAFTALIRTYFARGGYGIQFNIFDTETLIKAQKHPEDYQTLQVRVCGWNVYFVTMDPEEQEQYIRSNKQYLA